MTAPAPDRAPDEAMRKAFEEWMGHAMTNYAPMWVEALWDAWQESARSQSAAIADARADAEFLHKRRGELVIERDRYKAALGQYPKGRDVILAAALAEIENLRAALADARAEVERLRERIVERNNADPITRLHNLADAMEESRNDSPYTQEAWDAQDEAYRLKCGELASMRAQLLVAQAEARAYGDAANQAEAALAAKERECKAAAKLILGDLSTPQEILDATKAYNAARTDAAITQRAEE